ncbi:MAG TPA: SIMPL domain-containing protein [Hyphomicrobiales bacterium]|nr:SIMPL domain-containing protein [Hyphomicrobiales bacterium]
MTPKHTLPSLLLLSLLLGPGAHAQNQFSLGTLEPGQIVLNLTTTDQRQVEQDTLNATLDYVQQGRDREKLQDELNATMAKALALLEGRQDIESNTSRYQVYIVETNRPTRTDVNNPIWRAQQSVQLNSRDSAAVLELAGQLQELGLTMSGLYYSLSTERYEEVAAELTAQALGTLQQRAESAAASLGKGTAALVEVSMDGSANFGPVRERAMYAMSADATAAVAPPVATPGQTQVNVNLSARAVLSP